MVAAVRRSDTDFETKEFNTYTRSLKLLRDWCESEGVTHIAMESTGIYWRPVYNIMGNFGGALALVFMSPKKNVKEEEKFHYPDITGVAGLYTLNNTWGAGAFL